MPSGVYKRTNKTRKNLSIAHKGQKPWNTGTKGLHLSPKSEFKKGFIPKHTGKHRLDMVGEKHWNWQGGKTSVAMRIRTSLEYKLWRRAVFERDNFTCIWCGQIGGKLNVDHIKPFSEYPELRFAIDNGRTLCLECHKTTDNYLVHRGNKWKK